jgi:cytochrome c oxidase assembly protein subunit 11
MEKTTKFKNIYFVFYVFLFAFGMLGLSFASVPLYDLFCRVTGYAGTTQKASLAPGPKVDASLYKVRFDANISPDLNRAFVAPSDEIQLKPGVEKIIYYTAKNLSNEPSTGTASFNVSPPKAGSVFMKIECFCFINQKLMPNEEIKMPVSFYIDPEIDNDDNLKSLNEITLSYTFFKVE